MNVGILFYLGHSILSSILLPIVLSKTKFRIPITRFIFGRNVFFFVYTHTVTYELQVSVH